MNELAFEELIRDLADLRRRVEGLQIPEVYRPMATINVSDPPTDAELDAEFGTPAAVGAGFRAYVWDFVDSKFWQVASNGANWFTDDMNLAV